MLYIQANVSGGTDINKAIRKALRLSKKLDTGIEFRHNGILVSITPKSDPDAEYFKWERQLQSTENALKE